MLCKLHLSDAIIVQRAALRIWTAHYEVITQAHNLTHFVRRPDGYLANGVANLIHSSQPVK